MPRFDSIQWRVDYVLASSYLQEVAEPSVHVNIADTTGKSHAFEMTSDQIGVLLHGMLFCCVLNVNRGIELKTARARMQQLTSQH